MPGFLRQSTASQTRTLGPFVDSGDFITPEPSLTIANTDIKLNKNGAAAVNKNSGGGTSISNGNYAATFDATDTGTVGELSVTVVVSGAAPFFDRFIVLEEAVYDMLYASGATGPGGVPQTGDSFAILNHATHGLAAIWGYVTDGFHGLHRIMHKLQHGVAATLTLDKTGYSMSTSSETSMADAVLTAATSGRPSGSLGNKIEGIDAKTTNLPASPAATGDIPTANSIRDAIFARAYHSKMGSYTHEEIIALLTCVTVGKLVVTGTAPTQTFTWRNLADSANAVVATTDATGRITLTFTPGNVHA